MDSELVKIIQGLLGKWPAKIAAWVALLLGILWAAQFAVQVIDWLSNRFAGVAFQWGIAMNALVVSLFSTFALIAMGGALGAFIGILLGIGLAPHIQDAIDEATSEMADVLKAAESLELNAETKSKLSALYLRTQNIQQKQHKRIVNKIARFTRRQQGKQDQRNINHKL